MKFLNLLQGVSLGVNWLFECNKLTNLNFFSFLEISEETGRDENGAVFALEMYH